MALKNEHASVLVLQDANDLGFELGNHRIAILEEVRHMLQMLIFGLTPDIEPFLRL